MNKIEFAQLLRREQTPHEKILWNCLRDRKLGGYKFTRQHPILYAQIGNDKIYYFLDFYCSERKLGVEVDG